MIRPPRCPFCHDAVSRGESLVVCRECHAFHHLLCYEEGAGCAACQRRWLSALPRGRGRRFAAALAVFFGFLFGQVLGASVTLATRTSEPVPPPLKCELCCPRHHHHCNH